MVRTNRNPTPMFWNFAGFAIAVLSIGTSWSISQAKVYQMELAQYKLAVGGALLDVQKVSDTLGKSAERLPINPAKKAEIKQQLSESNAVIEQAQQSVNQDIKQLSESAPTE